MRRKHQARKMKEANIIIRRANEIKILDTNERKLKTKSFSFIFLSSRNSIQFKSVKQSFYGLRNKASHQKIKKTSPIISIFTEISFSLFISFFQVNRIRKASAVIFSFNFLPSPYLLAPIVISRSFDKFVSLLFR